jgi:hypothetical protein
MTELSDRESTNIFWKEKNEICIGCKNKCKQSNKVKIEFCPKYISKVTNENKS